MAAEEQAMGALAVVLLAAVVVVFILLAVEARQWRTGRLLISRGRFVVRIIGGLVLAGLLGGIFYGLMILRLVEPDGRPALFLGYWLGCVAAALALIVLALQEMKGVIEGQQKRENELWKEIARLIARSQDKKK